SDLDGSPLVPRAAAVLGPSYGDSALHASTAHFVVMIRNSSLALVGPSVIESALGEEISDEDLGGPDKAMAAGNAHMCVDTEADAMEAIAAFLSFLPPNSALPAPVAPARPPAVSPMRWGIWYPSAPRPATTCTGSSRPSSTVPVFSPGPMT